MIKIIAKLFNKNIDITENTSPRLESSILEVLNNINLKYDFSQSTLLEIGSRDGLDSYRIKNLLNIDSKNVLIVEANPTCCEFIRKKYPKFRVINYAIYNKEESLTFNKVLKENIGTSSLLDRRDNYYHDKSEKISVSAIRGETLLKKFNLSNIGFCKIDVEGATYEVIESFEDMLSTIQFLHIECEHKQVWENQKLYDDIKKLLEFKNFEQVFFEYVSDEKLQSDSIWRNKNKLELL